MATLSRTLPKSKSHRSNVSALVQGPAQAVHTGTTTAPFDHVDVEEQKDKVFAHPDQVVPPPNYEGTEHLIIVCCHAIFHPDISSSSFPLHNPYNESNWLLAPFQRSNQQTMKSGEHETFISHILAGLDALTSGFSHNSALLVLSGGPTKSSLTPLSEARSYYHAALALELAQGNRGGGRAHKFFTTGRILLEEHATDSYQNLLFSILLFHRTTGKYPKQIRIITHAFKTKRFLHLHAPAIKWPSSCIQIQGIDPAMSSQEYDETMRGEELSGYASWKQDPMGTGKALNEKRKQRGWDESVIKELGEGLEESVQVLLWGKASEVLPWSETAPSTE
jgi:hypothetical protein